jgi:hypothetical protein
MMPLGALPPYPGQYLSEYPDQGLSYPDFDRLDKGFDDPPAYRTDSVMGDDIQMNEFLPGNLRVLPAAPQPVAAAQQAPQPVAAPLPVVNRVSQAPYAKNQTPVQTGTILPPSGAEPGKSLWEQIGTNKEADLALALALGGFSMAEAAGKPGATPLSAFGTGAKTGISAAANARAAAKKEAMDKELLGIKRQTAQAALAKAKQGTLGETEKLIRLRDRFDPENPDEVGDYKRIQAIIDKKGQFSDTESFDAVEKAQRGIDRLKSKDGWEDNPATVKKIGQLNARIQKLSQGSDGLTALAKALSKGDQKFSQEYAKSDVGRIDLGRQAGETLYLVDNLETTVRQVDYTGGWTGEINNLKRTVGSLFKEAGLDTPGWLQSSDNVGQLQSQGRDLVSRILKGRMGSRPSDKDLQFLIGALPNLGYTKEENIRIANDLRSELVGQLKGSISVLKRRAKNDPNAREDLLVHQARYNEYMGQMLEAKRAGRLTKIPARLKRHLQEYVNGLPE